MRKEHRERVFVAEVGLKRAANADARVAGLLLLGLEDEHFGALGARFEAVAHRAVGAVGPDAAARRVDFGIGDRTRGVDVELVEDGLGIGDLEALDLHGGDLVDVAARVRHDGALAGLVPGDPLGAVGRSEALEAIADLLRGIVAAGDDLVALLEVGAREVVKVGRDQDVLGAEVGKRLPDVLLGEEVHHLRHHGDDVAELLALEKRRAHVHRNDDVGAHFAGE